MSNRAKSQHHDESIIDEDTLIEIKKASDLMTIIGSLQQRIEGHLGRACSDAMKKNDAEYMREFISLLPEGFHKSEMKKYLHRLETGHKRDDDYFQE